MNVMSSTGKVLVLPVRKVEMSLWVMGFLEFEAFEIGGGIRGSRG